MKELIKIQHELKAKKTQYNKFGKYHYRSLEDIVEAVKPLLLETKSILLMNDEIVQVGDRYYVKATVTLQSDNGDKVSVSAMAREALSQSGMAESQLTGATSSYARKYALNGLFAIDDTKDADSMDNSKDALPVMKDATPEDIKAAMTAFKELCEAQEVDPAEFLASLGVDTSDTNEKYKAARKWLKSIDLLNDQLLTYKQS